jgi:hypothetical protein
MSDSYAAYTADQPTEIPSFLVLLRCPTGMQLSLLTNQLKSRPSWYCCDVRQLCQFLTCKPHSTNLVLTRLLNYDHSRNHSAIEQYNGSLYPAHHKSWLQVIVNCAKSHPHIPGSVLICPASPLPRLGQDKAEHQVRQGRGRQTTKFYRQGKARQG